MTWKEPSKHGPREWNGYPSCGAAIGLGVSANQSPMLSHSPARPLCDTALGGSLNAWVSSLQLISLTARLGVWSRAHVENSAPLDLQ